ncbi:hypothetical protein PUY80_15585 [Plantibacter flavus]|uniref:hypothetical protein n=1 Tax=Plantibacter flavus TaxID=150123 RepID=UPI002379D23E|nr:hypothetical protein [Plantibacter flavus]MDD9153991.1 hypothetical protein [Plantibacter flavus]
MASKDLEQRQVEQIFLSTFRDVRSYAVSDVLNGTTGDEDLAEFPLYLVGLRPRVQIVGETEQDGKPSLKLRSGAGSELEIRFDKVDFDSLEVFGNGGYFRAMKDGEAVFQGHVSSLLALRQIPVPLDSVESRTDDDTGIDEDFLDLRVVYVGKSEDIGGAINNRLPAHSTLQRILANVHDFHPDFEIVIVLFRPELFTTLTAILPTEGNVSTNAIQVAGAMQPSLDRGTTIAVAEASMIRLFEPKYNVHYKTTFPSQSHTSYTGVLPFGYNSLGVLLETQHTLGFRLYSEAVKPSFMFFKAWSVDPKRRAFSSVDDLMEMLPERESS